MKMNKVIAIVMTFVFCSIAIFAFAGGGKKPSNGTISGTIKDSATGAAIVGATVTAGSTNATTNSSGSYSMSVAAGSYTVTASATGYTAGSQQATVTANTTTTVNFSLVKIVGANGTISGTVKDSATSAAIVGATVTAGTTNATTNSSGSYSMSVPAQSYTVTASATGYTSGSQQATVTANATTTVNFSLVKPPVTSNYRVIAWNDLGMHCACPSFAGFLLLPPFNTVRAQVMQVGGKDPLMITQTQATGLGLSINYAMVENTDANLIADAYFSQWITYSPKLFPGFVPVKNGVVQGLANNGLYGTMAYDSNLLDWKAVGIPAYPITTGDSKKDTMIDPLGGPNRDPYLTANVFVKNSSGQVLAQTTTVVPVAFGGCCTCHLKLAAANGYPGTPEGSFAHLGVMHSKNSSGINIALIDPDGDGVGGPVRCSWCHWDPAMPGENAAPGWPSGTKLLPGAGTLKKSQYSFSDVLHRFHAQDPLVLSSTYDPNIAKNCYDCHPGNNVNCYRGAHLTKTGTPAANCYDCHGDLNQRIATGQLAQPWKTSTLPSCSSPAKNITSNFACHSRSTVGGATYPATPDVFGAFINGRGHKGSIKCQTCHGEPHAEAPSTLDRDNAQLSAVQSSVAGATYPSGKDKTYALGVCKYCHSGKTTTWGVPPH